MQETSTAPTRFQKQSAYQPRASSIKSILVSFIVFLIVFIAWRHLRPEGILFYQGMALGVIVSIAYGAISWRVFNATVSTALESAFFCFLLIYSFVFTVPTTVDRAYSVKMLAHIGAHPAGLDRAQIQQWFTSDFLERGGVQ
jgi:hypothetical protein